MKTLLLHCLHPFWTVETLLPNTCLYRINCEIEYDLFGGVAKLHQTQWHGNFQKGSGLFPGDAQLDTLNIFLPIRKTNMWL